MSPTGKRLLVVALASTAMATSIDDSWADAYVRVIGQQAPVRTGPGPGFRDVYTAQRGDIFPVLQRSTKGYYFRIELDDGTTGWVFGEEVFPFEVVDHDDPGILERAWRTTSKALLGPSPVPFADVEVSFSAGVLDGEGLFLVRPGWLIDKYFSMEAFAGLSPRKQKDVYLAGAGWTLRLAPGAAAGPYVQVGVGGAFVRPKVDNFAERKATLLAVDAGGGFEITFKKQITVRIDFRNWTIFDPDQASNGQEYSGGLAIFF